MHRYDNRKGHFQISQRVTLVKREMNNENT